MSVILLIQLIVELDEPSPLGGSALEGGKDMSFITTSLSSGVAGMGL